VTDSPVLVGLKTTKMAKFMISKCGRIGQEADRSDRTRSAARSVLLQPICYYSPSQKQQYGQDEQDEQDKKAATPSCTSCSSCQFWLLSRGL